MFMIIGGVLIIVGFAMTYRFMRNARRPRIEIKVNAITKEFVRQDHKKEGPKHWHGHVKYNYDGVNYEGKVLLHKSVKENDWIQVSVNPKDPALIDIYAPKKEQLAIAAIYALGVFLIVGSWIIVSYMEGW